jgi:formylmethanofuran--tetrahydromethanopterin N-formyltransferase
MKLNGVTIEDTFAEAFPMTAARVIVTAHSTEWVQHAVNAVTGCASSVIGCDCEAGLERMLNISETPDSRPGAALLFFGFSRDGLQKALVNRVAQCLLTCATTAVFNGLDGDVGKTIRIGGQLRYFGDGWQISKQIDGKRYWRIPTMDGEFLCEDEFGTTKGVAGGNLIFLGDTQANTLAAAELAVRAMRQVPSVILPFPGGVVRSGSKVGSKYKPLKASTNEAYCPTLRGVVPSQLPEGVNAAYEIVIDGLTQAAVEEAMRDGMTAAMAQPGLKTVTAGNYGGKLGPYHLKLRSLLQS